MWGRRYHLCTRKEAQVACRAAEGPRAWPPSQPVCSPLRPDTHSRPSGLGRQMAGSERPGLAKALGAGMLGASSPP